MLTELAINQFRNFVSINLQPSQGVNLILGDNAAGKTSLLEAIHLLALGRSFRSRSLKQLIQINTDFLQVLAKTQQQATPIGLRYSCNQGLQIRLNNAPLKKLSDLAQQLPLQIIPANSHLFFEQGPKYRRQFLDWGLFHVEPSFNFHWQSYKKIIQQRNSAIRQAKKNQEIQLWDSHLVRHGEIIDQYRQKRLDELLSIFSKIFCQICSNHQVSDIQPKYRTGWPKGQSLASTINENIERDKQLGYTRSGCHAADWSFNINGHDAFEILSRGEQKLFFIALSIAQLTTTRHDGQIRNILLFDDISSELDQSHQIAVLEQLDQIDVQCFITSTESNLDTWIKQTPDNNNTFHVKQGQLQG